jgi:hypothetical protein
MEIDHSAASLFRTCPLKYFYSYLAEGTGLQLKPTPGSIGPYEVGGRTHELLEEYYSELRGTPIPAYPEHPNPAVENECQIINAAYRAKYPIENFEIVDVERSFRVQLPNSNHIYTGKLDIVFRDEHGLNIMDHKTERRRGTSNHPKKWAARDQATLYLWAAERIYGEPIQNFYVNVLTRPSEKLREGPIFPERQRLERTAEQIQIALRDITHVADQIEQHVRTFGDNLWPANREECTQGTWGDCEFYLPDTYGWSDEIRKQKYEPKEDYQKLGGIPIIP